MKNALAHTALADSHIERADSLARDALKGFVRQREQIGIAAALDTLAAVAAASSDPERAARLGGASEGIHETIASQPAPYERAISGRFIKASQEGVGEQTWRAAWVAGHEMSREEAIEFALS